MIWNSITLMTSIDLTLLIGAIILVFIFRRQRSVARQLGVLPALHLILAGLLVVAIFYCIDLLTMHVVPRLTSHETGMQMMSDLHLNWAWLGTLFSVGLMATGLIYLMRELLPRASDNLDALEKAVEQRSSELREANLELEREHRRLQQSEERLDLASRATDDGLWEISDLTNGLDGDGWWSSRYRELLGEQADADDIHWVKRIHPEDQERIRHAFEAHLENASRFDLECRLRCARQQYRWFQLSGQVVWSEQGTAIRMAGSIQDITDKKSIEQRMVELDLAIENSMTGISRLDKSGLFTEVRTIYANMLGYDDERELIGQSWEATVVADDHEMARQGHAAMLREGRSVAEVRALRADGSEFIKQLFLIRIDDEQGEHDGHYCFMRDVTVEHGLAKKLSYQARHDALTGLINRAELETRLDQAIQTAHEDERTHALLYMDLDQFKVINDTCGHAAGDELLRQLAGLLGTKVRVHDTLSRLGGDEFGVLLLDCTLDQAMRVANEMRSAVEDFVFTFEAKSFNVGVSIGMVSISAGTGTRTEVLKDADAACYAAKEGGRNQVHLYNADDIRLANRQGEMRWVSRIKSALAEDRFELYQQPIISTSKTQTSGSRFEILLRLRDEHGELVLPGAFLPAANRYDLLPQIDRWVVTNTMDWLKHQAQAQNVGLCHINISGPSLASRDFLAFVMNIFDETGIDAARVCFEITESAVISDIANARRFIEQCRQRGCKFALDDFGSGLSSFGYLKNLTVDYVKIDGVFVRDLLNDPIDLAMVKAINDITKVMGMLSIAEYVESKEIFEMLQEIGVDEAQGYWIGHPQPLLMESRDAAVPRKSHGDTRFATGSS